MTQKEIDRAFSLDRVEKKQISLKHAAIEMQISYPQAKRLMARYKKEGRKGLISKKRGQKSNRAVSTIERIRIAKIITEHYHGCKPLYVSEKLKNLHGVEYSSEFIRQLMTEFHLWFPRKMKCKTHPRRPRRNSKGELLQTDASVHDWFEGRRPHAYLHVYVDDATSEIVGGHFSEEETTEGYYRALLPILEQKGRPIHIYTDKRGTFVVNKGKNGKTQFARAMEELGIGMITAHSPQAKGRIERTFGTLQDRLVWEMRLNHICTIEEANSFLPKFIEEYNNKYAKEPASSIDAYRPLNQRVPLKYILCAKEKRMVSKNLEVQYRNKTYQLMPTKGVSLCIKNAEVMVITTLEGELAFEFRGKRIDYVNYA
ncbi:MAG: ISNCY family transposase, partial [Simkania sp.]|nr:ISNCY family transposase [Simkania sp.]